MRKLLLIISIAIFSSCSASSQSVSTDSLTVMIRTLQKQVATLQSQMATVSQVHTITFDPASFSVVQTTTLNQTVSLKTVTVDLTAINAAISALQTKVAGLKAASVTITTIQ